MEWRFERDQQLPGMRFLFRAMAFLFVVLGGFMLITGFWLLASRAMWVYSAESSDGVLVEVREKGSGDEKSYQFVVDFEDHHGNTRREIMTAVKPSEHRVGETVPMLFDRDQPAEAMRNTFTGIWFLPALLIFFGVLFPAFIGLMLLVGKGIGGIH